MEEDAAKKGDTVTAFAPIGGLQGFWGPGKLGKYMESAKYDIVREPRTRNIYLNPIGVDLPYHNTLIFLHGLGDSAESLLDLFHEDGWHPNWIPPNCRIVLPTAPRRRVSLNNGKRATSWFDIHNNDMSDLSAIRQRYNQGELQAAAAQLYQLI